MNRHQRKYLGRAEAVARREQLARILDNTVSRDEGTRAEAVRALCPCRGPWPQSVRQEIIAACDVPSPRVRLEALHVLEDSPWPPHPHVYRLLRRACDDPDPRVAERARGHLNSVRLKDRNVRQDRRPSSDG